MAVIYLRSTDGNDADDGSTWALAKATLAAALTAAGAGGTVYVSQAHSETQASAMTLTSPGTAASPTLVICGNDGAAPPTAVATTATVSTTGANAISFAGFAYCYGVIFTAGNSGSNASINFVSGSPWWWRFEASSLRLGGNNSGGRIVAGLGGATVDDNLLELIDSTVSFAHAGHGIRVHCPFVWRGTASAILGTVPTTLFITPAASGGGGSINVYGVNLSAASGTIVTVGASFDKYVFVNCKLHASATLVSGTSAGQGGTLVEFINCDSGDTNYKYRKHCYQGDITQEDTIVRTAGASDGTTPISRKMVSSANSKLYSPLESAPILVWNETLSSLTATVEVVTDNVTLTDTEAWLEVEYLGTSGFPLSSFVSDRAVDILASAANQTSSSVTWTTTGLTTPVKQKLSVSFTPQEKGLIRARVMLAKASTTMYFCPKADIS